MERIAGNDDRLSHTCRHNYATKRNRRRGNNNSLLCGISHWCHERFVRQYPGPDPRLQLEQFLHHCERRDYSERRISVGCSYGQRTSLFEYSFDRLRWWRNSRFPRCSRAFVSCVIRRRRMWRARVSSARQETLNVKRAPAGFAGTLFAETMEMEENSPSPRRSRTNEAKEKR